LGENHERRRDFGLHQLRNRFSDEQERHLRRSLGKRNCRSYHRATQWWGFVRLFRPTSAGEGVKKPHLRIFLYQRTMGAPYPRISCGAWRNRRTSCGPGWPGPHTRPWVVPRTGIRVSDPFLVRCGIPRTSTVHPKDASRLGVSTRAERGQVDHRYAGPVSPLIKVHLFSGALKRSSPA
jgi:hypothetical protein